MGSLKGKTTRKVPEPVVNDYIEMPWEIIDLHKDTIIAAGVMSINKMRFLTSVSRKIKFTTSQKLNDREKPILIKCIESS
eukprot:14014308-Ditylum_brightwellii.AAC.1